MDFNSGHGYLLIGGLILVGAGLLMARGRAEGEPRIGFLLSPPYFPLRVGRDAD